MPDISYLKILVPTAGPAPAMEKAEYIIKLARKIRGEVLALHIVKSRDDKERCKQGNEALKIFEETGIRHNVKVSTFLAEGELLETIKEFAQFKDVDLIVMGGSEDGKMIAEWIVSDLRYDKDLPVVIAPPGFGAFADEI